jgi:hypothetical protein
MQGKECASAAINRLKALNRRTVEVIAAKLYFFYSYVYELTDSLLDIRGWVFDILNFKQESMQLRLNTISSQLYLKFARLLCILCH